VYVHLDPGTSLSVAEQAPFSELKNNIFMEAGIFMGILGVILSSYLGYLTIKDGSTTLSSTPWPGPSSARVIPNIWVSRIKMGTKLSRVALCAGANDLGGTVMEDKISVAGGSSHGEYLSREDLIGLITAIGRTPRERNTLYQDVKPGTNAVGRVAQ
jgi:hypothetical protein